MIKNYKISDKDFWTKINTDFGDSGGLYKLYCVDVNNNRIGIERVVKSDSKGILYIGKAISFLDRVITLKKSLSPLHHSSNHDCGARYKSSTFLMEKFPFERLWIELIGCKNIEMEEKTNLKEYEIEFGELPPLNRNK